MKAKEREEAGGKPSPFAYGTIRLPNDKYKVGIVVNRAYVILVPFPEFYLDLKKVFENKIPVDISDLIKWEDIEYSDVAVDLKTIKTITDGRKVKVFETDPADELESRTIWISTDAFKYFYEEALYYKATEKNKPVYFIEDNDLVAVVMPVNY